MDRYTLDPRNPVYALPYSPEGGSGIVKATIFVTFGQNETSVERMLAYSWSKTVNGTEVEVEKPWMPNANAIEEDIYNAMKDEVKFDTLSFISQPDLIWHRKPTKK